MVCGNVNHSYNPSCCCTELEKSIIKENHYATTTENVDMNRNEITTSVDIDKSEIHIIHLDTDLNVLFDGLAPYIHDTSTSDFITNENNDILLEFPLDKLFLEDGSFYPQIPEAFKMVSNVDSELSEVLLNNPFTVNGVNEYNNSKFIFKVFTKELIKHETSPIFNINIDKIVVLKLNDNNTTYNIHKIFYEKELLIRRILPKTLYRLVDIHTFTQYTVPNNEFKLSFSTKDLLMSIQISDPSKTFDDIEIQPNIEYLDLFTNDINKTIKLFDGIFEIKYKSNVIGSNRSERYNNVEIVKHVGGYNLPDTTVNFYIYADFINKVVLDTHGNNIEFNDLIESRLRIYKSSWQNNTILHKQIADGLSKLFKRSEIKINDDDDYDYDDSIIKLSDEIIIDENKIRSLLTYKKQSHMLLLRMLSINQFSQILDRLYDIGKMIVVNNKIEINVSNIDSIISYTNIIDADVTIPNIDRWEINITHKDSYFSNLRQLKVGAQKINIPNYVFLNSLLYDIIFIHKNSYLSGNETGNIFSNSSITNTLYCVNFMIWLTTIILPSVVTKMNCTSIESNVSYIDKILSLTFDEYLDFIKGDIPNSACNIVDSIECINSWSESTIYTMLTYRDEIKLAKENVLIMIKKRNDDLQVFIDNIILYKREIVRLNLEIELEPDNDVIKQELATVISSEYDAILAKDNYLENRLDNHFDFNGYEHLDEVADDGNVVIHYISETSKTIMTNYIHTAIATKIITDKTSFDIATASETEAINVANAVRIESEIADLLVITSKSILDNAIQARELLGDNSSSADITYADSVISTATNNFNNALSDRNIAYEASIENRNTMTEKTSTDAIKKTVDVIVDTITVSNTAYYMANNAELESHTFATNKQPLLKNIINSDKSTVINGMYIYSGFIDYEYVYAMEGNTEKSQKIYILSDGSLRTYNVSEYIRGYVNINNILVDNKNEDTMIFYDIIVDNSTYNFVQKELYQKYLK